MNVSDNKTRQNPINSISNQLDFPSPEELKNLPPDGGPRFNRLIFEKSPYLLQHAANPVNWFPWGEEAFQKADQEDKPIFLSIGYSTCHWCHVMEHESFEDPDIAALLNETFIPIKVDREERPDIDQIYMSVCQAVTGTGGWPLTVILTPDKLPFFTGTYFPKEGRFGRTGLVELIPKIDDLWKNKRGELLESADQIVNYLKQNNSPELGELDDSILEKAYQQLNNRFDPVQGGFGTSPKFPTPHNLIFLLRYWHKTGEKKALEMVEKTLQKMRLGGVFDHIGFGFHRYSTDASWFLPHFEKMLYDQALLVMAYLEGFQASGKKEYAQTAHEIIEYVLRDMTSPEGGFYSAEDADSEGEEGLFYLWTPDEFKEYFGDEDSELFINIFNLEEEGNFIEEASKTKTGRSIIYLKESLDNLAKENSLTKDKIKSLWEKARQLLFGVREERIHPLKDDKILTEWNGLMIAALAKASSVLGEPIYAQTAKKAVDFIWNNLRDNQGRLLKRYRDGESRLPAHLDDYAFLVWGLTELYQAEFETDYLEKALELNLIMLEDFWDEENGGLFLTAKGQSDLIIRSKEIYDGAIPSGNSIAALNLLRLGRMTANLEYEEKARQIGNTFFQQVSQVPQGHTQLLSALVFAFGPSFEVVITGEPDKLDTDSMLNSVQRKYNPNTIILFKPAWDASNELIQLSPFVESQVMVDGKATAYVCQDYACNAPTTDLLEMEKQLGR